MNDDHEILSFVKALAHADRLKIVGLLAQTPAHLAEIAEGCSLPIRQVFQHLAFLEFVGVVHQKDDLYQLDTQGLERLAQRQFSGKRPPFTPETELEKEHQKALAAFLAPDGSIRQVPNSRTQPAKFRLILQLLLAAFEPGVVYTEKEVNNLIRRFNPDVAGLRRDLIDAGLLARERDGSKYWRPENGCTP